MSEADTKQEKAEQIEQIANASMGQMEKEERVLVRKIDLYLLPTIWMMYLWSYMDRTKYVRLILSITSYCSWEICC